MTPYKFTFSLSENFALIPALMPFVVPLYGPGVSGTSALLPARTLSTEERCRPTMMTMNVGYVPQILQRVFRSVDRSRPGRAPREAAITKI